jgi:hypothetical protein
MKRRARSRSLSDCLEIEEDMAEYREKKQAPDGLVEHYK